MVQVEEIVKKYPKSEDLKKVSITASHLHELVLEILEKYWKLPED